MKNLFSKKALALILTVLSICAALTGCAKNKIKGISLSEIDTPRLVYILGEELDLSRGSIIATYDKEEKTVALDDPDVSVSGYDNTKLGVQTLTVGYQGKTAKYEITVYSSVIQAIYDTAEKLSGVDLSGDGINLDGESGEIALSAMTEHLGLSDSEKSLVDGDKLSVIIAPAIYHASKLYNSELQAFSDSFVIDGNGEATLVGAEYEKTKSDLGKLESESGAFNISYALLSKAKTAFKDYTLPNGKTVEGFINLVSEESLDFSKKAMKLTTSMHEALAPVPKNWSVSDLENYEDGILEAVSLVTESDFIGVDYRYVFEIANGWREASDSFDIIYSYYCYAKEDGPTLLQNGLWQILPLPDALWNWYYPLYNAAKEAVLMAENENGAYTLHDTARFMLLYRSVLSAKEEIDRSNDALSRDVYSAICGDAVFENNLRRALGGYITHSGGMLGNKAYDSLWEKYLDVISLESKRILDFEAHGQLISDLFDSLVDLAPSEVHGFLSSLNYLYKETDGEILLLDPDKAYNRFAVILNSYYESKLSEAARPAFKNLLCAIESYALYSVNGEESPAKDSFNTAVESLTALRASLKGDDAELLDSLLGKCYEKYLGIYSYESVSTSLAQKFEALSSTLSQFFEEINKDRIPEAHPDYILLFSLYERANGIYSEILLSRNKQAITALFAERYDMAGENITLDTAFYISRTVFISNLVSILVDDEDAPVKPLLFDVYRKTKLVEFLKEASYVIDSRTPITKDTAKSIMEAFRALGTAEKELFYKIGPSLYYDSLEAFFIEQFPEDNNAKEFIRAILEAEYSYFSYVASPANTEYINSFKEKMLSAISYYALIFDHNTRDTYFLSTYQYYAQIYYSLV